MHLDWKWAYIKKDITCTWIQIESWVTILTADNISSVAQSCPTLWNLMDLEPAHIHVHRIGDAIQPSHPLSSPPLTAFNLSQHQGLFQWVSSLHQVAKVLEFQHQLLMNIQNWFPLGLTGLILQSNRFSRVCYNTTVKHQFFSTQLYL